MNPTATGAGPIYGLPTLAVLCHTALRDQDTERWKEIRRTTVGGHGVTALYGMHPRHKPVDLWLGMTGSEFAPVDFGDNERTRGGRLLEPVIAGWFGVGGEEWDRGAGPMGSGPLMTVTPPVLTRTDRPWQRISPDRLVYHAPVPVDLRRDDGKAMQYILQPPGAAAEIKSHGFMGGRSYDDDEWEEGLPDDKRIQVTWYSSGMEIEWWYVLALIDTHIQRTWVIRRDKEVEAYMLEEVERFLRVNVAGGIEPSPDGSASFGRYLSERFKKHRPELLPASPETDEWAVKYKAAFLVKKKAAEAEAIAKQNLERLIGDAAGVMTSEGKIGWGWRPSGKYREKELREELFRRLGLTPTQQTELLEGYVAPGYRSPSHPLWKDPK